MLKTASAYQALHLPRASKKPSAAEVSSPPLVTTSSSRRARFADLPFVGRVIFVIYLCSQSIGNIETRDSGYLNLSPGAVWRGVDGIEDARDARGPLISPTRLHPAI